MKAIQWSSTVTVNKHLSLGVPQSQWSCQQSCLSCPSPLKLKQTSNKNLPIWGCTSNNDGWWYSHCLFPWHNSYNLLLQCSGIHLYKKTSGPASISLLSDSWRRLFKLPFRKTEMPMKKNQLWACCKKGVNAAVTAGLLEAGSIFTSMAEERRTLKGFFSLFSNSLGKKREQKRQKPQTRENYLIGLVFIQNTEGNFFFFCLKF